MTKCGILFLLLGLVTDNWWILAILCPFTALTCQVGVQIMKKTFFLDFENKMTFSHISFGILNFLSEGKRKGLTHCNV